MANNLGIYGSPFATSNLYNDDFMWNATMATQNPYQQYGNPAFGGMQAYQQPKADTFQSSGPAWGTGAVCALGGGGLATAGAYWLGGESLSPFKDGKIDDKFLKTVEEDFTEALKKAKSDAVINKKMSILTTAGETYTKDQLQVLQKIANGEDIALLNTAGINPSMLTKEEAAKEVQRINKLLTDNGFSRAKIEAEAAKKFLSENTLEGASARLKELLNQESLIKAMKDDGDLVELIKKNSKAFGISGTEEEIKTAAEKLAADMGGSKNLALEHLRKVSGTGSSATLTGGLIHDATNTLEGIRGNLKSQIELYIQDGGKTIAEGAPESLTKAFRSFKLNKAGKYGLLAAGVGLLLGAMFGGNNKA